MTFRRRPAIAVTADFDGPILDFGPDVPLASSIHSQSYRPPSLKQVMEETHFSKNEIKAIYRAFKETAPNALINREILREKFTELFPQGDSRFYSDLLFDTFDNDGNGTISFMEFVKALSVLCRGTVEEKIDWVYKFYDPQGVGRVTWDRMHCVLTSADSLIGKKALPRSSRRVLAERTREIFEKFDKHDKGHITREEFLQICRNDAKILRSIACLYTILPG
ncbi:unnamed protein product [Auanema sp. JU1783]|nr:unnamed protein product [Auanema sp. JU1783]